MFSRPHLALLLAVVTAMAIAAFQRANSEDALIPAPEGRRLEVLFLGSENKFNHDPLTRFRVIRKALGPKGINFTYSETLDVLTPENLARYDVLLIFANHETIADGEQKALINFARSGGGCVLLHCAAGCFRQSAFDDYVDLLGAQFKSHGKGVFRAKIVNRDHPITKDWEGFECWDESYVHKRHGEGRTILQRNEDEPWSWVKTYGKGRVFYTASGHDHRCWDLPQYHDLIHRAVRWTAGDDKTGLLDALALPELKYRPAAVPKDPDNPVGPLNEIQHPLPPDESLKLAQIPAGFELKLFASEPMIVNPISINWDDRGRLWAVEAYDYPHKIGTEDPQDRIVILEDTDRDGVADKRHVFADKLNICTSALPMHDGAIATDGPNMVYLRDTTGDGNADDRQVLFSGLGLRDTHACTSNLRHGFDGWIYGTVGYSGLDVTVAGVRHKSSQGVFRFRPDASAFEILQNTSNNTWGIGFTEEGDLVGSTANGNPSWYLTIPNRYFEMVGRKPQQVARADKQERLFPITTDYFQNNPKEQSSSGAGHAIYTARRFPEEWWNSRAFICEPPLHLVAAPQHRNIGDRFETTHFENNLYASADAWSAPVAAEVGPDGAVWIADWYNPICNHNNFRPHHKRGAGNAHVNDDRDRKHGRIYRIHPKGSKDDAYPKLETLEDCLVAFDHPNLFWRLTALRRFGVVTVDSDPNLYTKAILKHKGDPAFPETFLHAVSFLPGNEPLNNGPVRTAATSRKDLHLDEKWDPDVGLPPLPSAQDLLTPGNFERFAEASLNRDLAELEQVNRHPLVRKELVLSLATKKPSPTIGSRLAELLRTDKSLADYRHLADAIRLAVLKHPEGYVRHLIEKDINPDEAPLKRPSADLLTRVKSDPSILSDGLLALARNSEHKLAKRLVAAIGAPPKKLGPVARSESARRGEDLYFTCVACHQPDGEGLPGAFPPLVESPRVLGDAETLIKIVLKGIQGPITTQGKKFDGMMPGHETTLNDQQIADVLNYVRRAWGNDGGGIAGETVKRVRARVADRKKPWTDEELK